MKRIYIKKVPAQYSGRPLRDFLKQSMMISASLLSRLKKTQDGIMVNAKPEMVVYTLKTGDVVQVTLMEEASLNIVPIKGNVDVLYEDEDLILVNKPSGIATHISHGNYENTLSNYLLYYLNQSGQAYTFHGVTRLDKLTSGIVLVAKNAHIHGLMAKQLKNGKLKKEYSCIVKGNVSCAGIVDAPIGRAPGSAIHRCVRPDGKPALTEYEPVARLRDVTFLHVRPVTGRTHQIRVHMAHIGHPLAGDGLYGGGDLEAGFMLCCCKLSFYHPILEKELSFSVEPPEQFHNFWQKNREK